MAPSDAGVASALVNTGQQVGSNGVYGDTAALSATFTVSPQQDITSL